MAKILVVDDRPTNRKVLMSALKAAGHAVLEAADGAAALDVVRSERPALVITDILMPTMDGFEFTQRLRGDPDIAQTPVVFYTATYRGPEARAMASLCQVSTVLPKPCDAKTLLAAVHQEIGLSAPEVTVEKLLRAEPAHDQSRLLSEGLDWYQEELSDLQMQAAKLVPQVSPASGGHTPLTDLWARTLGSFRGLHDFSTRIATIIQTSLLAPPEQGPAHVAESFFKAASRIMGCSYAALCLLDDSGGKKQYIFTTGVDRTILNDSAGRDTELLATLGNRRGVRPIRRDGDQDPVAGLPPGHPPVGSFLGVPVASREWQYGWMYFAERPDARKFNAEDERIAAALAGELSVFYENAILYDIMQRHASQLQVEIVRRQEAEEQNRQRERQYSQAQKMEAVGQLTGGIAHDFNNLLTVIHANAEDLIDELKAAPLLARQADMILQAAGRGADLVRQLMAFARKQTLRPELIDIGALIESVARLLQRTLQKNIVFEIVHRAEASWVNVDPGSLENALINLAINARDAMPQGGSLTIETANATLTEQINEYGARIEAGRYLHLAVKDTGMGMSDEVRAKAFEPFFTTKEVGKGTGLGLSMVYGFVQQSGGHARIDSAPGSGTAINIFLPLAAPPAAKTEPLKAAVGAPGGASSAAILLVEDDELVRQSVESRLLRLGYRVTAVETAADAIATLEQNPAFNLVFTDVIMPGTMTGADLARQVLARWPGIKVLATSGYTESTMLGKVQIPAGVLLLSKPYSNAELAKTVGDALQGAAVPA